MHVYKKSALGFTLIELMVTVIIVGILAAIALPAYNNYVMQSRISVAVAQLADMRVKMEQYFQDNRTYVGACANGTVAPLPSDTTTFTFSCTCVAAPAASTYTVCATGVDPGPMDGFIYTIDQANTRRTTGLPAGWSGVNSACWVLKQGGSC